MNATSEGFLLCLFILLTENGRYKGLTINLENDFSMGQSNYPKTAVAAKSLLTEYITPGKSNYVKKSQKRGC